MKNSKYFSMSIVYRLFFVLLNCFVSFIFDIFESTEGIERD